MGNFPRNLGSSKNISRLFDLTSLQSLLYRKQIVNEGTRNHVLQDGTLVIRDVQSEDSGNYTCSLHNDHGNDEVTYSLVVMSKLKTRISSGIFIGKIELTYNFCSVF